MFRFRPSVQCTVIVLKEHTQKNRIAAAKRKLDRDEEAVKNKCGENKRKREFLLNQLRVIEAEQEEDVKNYLLVYNFMGLVNFMLWSITCN